MLEAAGSGGHTTALTRVRRTRGPLVVPDIAEGLEQERLMEAGIVNPLRDTLDRCACRVRAEIRRIPPCA